ncbi:hypothetical protein MMC15_001857 [Xylographa vitiligo]|nr:hypothetical protein [Xylographa vitiligo]
MQAGILTKGLISIYPTAYVGIQDFRAVTDCSIPGCTAVEDCNPQVVDDYISETGFPFRGITTAGYYYINGGLDFGGSFDQDMVQQFLSLLDLPSGCSVVLDGPPYTLMPVAQLTETCTITSPHQGQTPSPVASPGMITPLTTLTPSAPYYLITGTLKANTVGQSLASSSSPAPDGVTLSMASVSPSLVPFLTPSPTSLGPSVYSTAITAPALLESSPFLRPTTAAALPIIVLGTSSITINSVSQYAFGSRTLVPGGPAITVSGTTISLATSASAISVNGITQNIPTPPISLPPNLYSADAPLDLGGIIRTADAAGAYMLGTQTLIPGGPGITISGTTVSLASSDVAIIVNGHTHSAETNLSTPKSYTVVATVGGAMISQNSAGAYEIGSQTITPGGPAISIDGTPVSLDTVGTGVNLVIAGSTEVLTFAASAGGLEPSNIEGLGGIIFSGLAGLPVPSTTGKTVVDTNGAGASWEMHWWIVVLSGTLIVLGGFSI